MTQRERELNVDIRKVAVLLARPTSPEVHIALNNLITILEGWKSCQEPKKVAARPPQH